MKNNTEKETKTKTLILHFLFMLQLQTNPGYYNNVGNKNRVLREFVLIRMLHA